MWLYAYEKLIIAEKLNITGLVLLHQVLICPENLYSSPMNGEYPTQKR